MSGATGECIESKMEVIGLSRRSLEPQDILHANEILHRLGRPLSWKELNEEFSKHQQGGDVQSLKDAFCRSKAVGFLVCEDFIALDTLQMIALLKLQLIIIICEKYESSRLCEISFIVNASMTDEEQSHLGTDPTALAKEIRKYQEIFTLADSIFVANSVVKTTDKTLKFPSFFKCEKSSPTLSAIHKVKYFLNLCHGKSSTFTTFEFVQNFLTLDERMSLGKTRNLCMKQMQTYQDDIKISGDSVELLPHHRWYDQLRKAETIVAAPEMDGQVIESKAEEVSSSSRSVDPHDVQLANEILHRVGRPLSWKELNEEFSKHQQGGDVQSLKDAFCRSKVIDFLVCEDFISLDTVEMTALLKLQLIVVICEKFKSGRLCKISFIVNASMTKEEQKHLGTNPTDLAKEIGKHQEIFTLSDCLVKTTDKTVTFHSFFMHEKSSPVLSAVHKIKYFLNLCHGKSSSFTTFEFVQNFLTPHEKVSLGKTKMLCMKQIQAYQDDLKINGETVELLSHHRWLKQPGRAQTFVAAPKVDGHAKIGSDMASPTAEQISLAKSILSDTGKPLSWEEFSCEYSKFKPGSCTQILQDTFCKSNVGGLFSSRDFISLDTPECIGLLKLQLVVAIHERVKDHKFSKICHKFCIIATEEEKDCYGNNSELVLKSMHALPDVFCISSSEDEVWLQADYSPKQNSFFMYEEDAKLSAVHKLKYFLYLSHGASSDSVFFEFSRCLLTKAEKKYYSGNICGEVMELIKFLSDFDVVGSTVKLVPSSKSKQQGQNVKDGGNGPSGHAKIGSDMASPTAEKISLAKSILTDRGRPLSWEEFSCEYSKFKPGSCTQTLQDTFCKSNVGGLFSSRDFISLDTPECIGLLKLQLVVAIHERVKDNKFSKICHKFCVIATEEEKDCYGHNSELVLKSMHALPDVFRISSSEDEVWLQADYSPKQNSFFMYEEDAKLSAVHKLKYFLYLSHGASSDSAFFEFSRCLLTKAEKKYYSGDIFKEVMDLINIRSDFEVDGSTVKLVPLSKSKQHVQNVKDVGNGPSGSVSKAIKTNNPSLQQQDDILLLREILQSGPLSWSEFADEYAKHRPVKSSKSLQETIYQSSPNGFLYSPDFISLHNAKSVALIKLQLIVVTNNRLQNGQLGKISYHFNIAASDKERELFGRNSEQLGQSLQKLSQLFCFLEVSDTDRNDLREVKPSSQTLLFHSFFSVEGNDKASLIHKLQYFINLCGGKSSSFSLYEFGRNLLNVSEKRFFKIQKDSFVELISSMSNHFQVLEDDIKLHQRDLWRCKLKKVTDTAKLQVQDHGGGTRSNTELESLPEPPDVLTADFVKNILNNYARYPMDWNEFKAKFLKSKQNADAMVADFLKNCPQKGLKSLCFSSDFLALNTPFHRNRLKLQLILAIRKKSTEPSLISMEKFKTQFEEIASQQEIEQTELNCDDIRGFLDKFPRVFAIQENKYVKQARKALQFPSFFQHERDDPLVSVVHKLNYFVHLCGDYGSISLVCKFLQKHLTLKRELQLVNTDEKVLALIQNCETDDLNPDKDEEETNSRKNESDEERKAIAADRAQEVEGILSEQAYAISWRHLENLCFSDNKSKDWVTEFREHYLPVLDAYRFLFSKEFISLNRAFDRAFLKLCLLSRLYIKKKGQCPLPSLFRHFQGIASGVEKSLFYSDIESRLSNFPLVFKLDVKSSTQCHVSPGEGMVSFSDFFTCEEHGKEDCLHCQLRFFMKICGGRCHEQKAHNFLQILSKLSKENDKNAEAMSTHEVDKLIKKCDIVKEKGNSDMYVFKPPLRTSSGHTNDTSKASSTPEKNLQALQQSTEGISKVPPTTEGTVTSSTTKMNIQSASPSKNLQPATASLGSEKSTPVKSSEGTLVSSDNSSTEMRRLVKVKIVRNIKVLKQVVDRMLNFECPIISLAYCEDALVILNWEGNGFVIPFKKTYLAAPGDGTFAQKWSLLGEFFQNPAVTQVTFDCDAIGRYLLENFNIQLNDTVFDVKVGAELLPSEWKPSDVSNVTVTDLCRCLKLPSPDEVDVQIVGDLKPDGGEVSLEELTVTETVREASALIPGIYGKIFQFLETRDGLKLLHRLTGDKLQCLYNMNMDSLLPVEGNYPSEVIDTEPPNQGSSPSSISTGSSVPASSLNFSLGASSQVSSVDPAVKPHSSGFSEMGSAEDWFSTDIHDPTTVPSGVNNLFSQNQFPVTPNSVGKTLFSNQNEQVLSQELPASQSLPPGTQLPDFDQSILQDQPLSLCKDGAGGIIPVPVEEAGSYDHNLSGITEELVEQFAAKQKESMLELLLLLEMDIFETLRDHFKGDFIDSFNQLTEIVLDVGRNVEARLFRESKEETPETVVASGRVVTAKDLEEIEKTDVLTGFGDDNRCGIEGALHSLRRVRNKKKKMIGLTVRVHKPLLGCADMMYDIALEGKSTLIMGYSGVGKTTLLRELARCLNDTARKRVIVIDTSNEIAGDYDVPHFSIGGARRLQVDSRENQYKTLLESAKNHSPEILIVDEIESQNDAAALVKLCQQGIQVIAGVDGESVSNLFNDKNLYQLFQNGGDNGLDDSVSLDSAGALAKAKARPAFQALVEMVGCNRWYLHDLAFTYNRCLSGQPYSVQERTRIGFKPGLVREQQIVLREMQIQF